MLDSVKEFAKGALSAFHSGVTNGTGSTETIEVGTSGPERAASPYWKTLAVAGLGGMMLTASVGANPAKAGNFMDGLVGDVFGRTVSMSQIETTSPRLQIFKDDWSRFNPDSDFIVVDVRDDSPTYGQGAPQALVDSLSKDWRKVGPHIEPYAKADIPGVTLEANEKPNVCIITVGGELLSGSVQNKAAIVAGVVQRDDNGDVVKTNGLPQVSPERLSVNLSDASMDNFIAYHEMGHCADRSFGPQVFHGLGKRFDTTDSYFVYKTEVQADIFATLMTARVEGHTRTGEEMANLRNINTLLRGGAKDSQFHPLNTTQVLDNSGARYYTTPGIDTAVAWINTVGIDKLQAMSPEEIVAKTTELNDQSRLSKTQFDRFIKDLHDTRFDNGKVVVSPDLPEGFAKRLSGAMKAQGFAPKPGDAPEMAGNAPSYKKAAPSVGLDSSLARIEGRNMARLLSADLADGATVVRIDRKGENTHIVLREKNGAMTKAMVSGDSDVVRYNADGQLASLSANRPAVQKIGGEVKHVIAVDGVLTPVSVADADRHFNPPPSTLDGEPVVVGRGMRR